MMSLKLVAISIFVLFYINKSHSLDNGLALTPPMGWLTWQRFRCNTDCVNDPENCISEELIKVMANRMVKDGYLNAGYEYIIIDDCWLAQNRDKDGRLQADSTRFPSGIPALADYIHKKGLKFGIYEDYGTLTCGGYPGSMEHLQLDAQTFADWGVDYLKFDGCNSDPKTQDAGYAQMAFYLNQTGRPIVFSCEQPLYQGQVANINPNYTAVAATCNLWRNYGDVQDSWDSVKDIYQWFGKHQGNFSHVHAPGSWNDPDMLVVGNYGLSYGQSQAQMAIWSIMAAPLIMSVDLRTIPGWAKAILQNDQMIAINQDKLGIMGKKFMEKDNVDMWSKPLTNERVAFVFVYNDPYGTPADVHVSLHDLGLTKYTTYHLYESFSGELIGTYNYRDVFNCKVNPSGSVFAFWAEPSQKMNGNYVQPLPVINLRAFS